MSGTAPSAPGTSGQGVDMGSYTEKVGERKAKDLINEEAGTQQRLDNAVLLIFST